MQVLSDHLSRRDFLKAAGALAASAAVCPRLLDAEQFADRSPHEARYYDVLDGNAVRCGLCPWGCVVPDGGRGRCGVRENRGGRYFSLVYGFPVALNNDPIEKKPFFHVYPQSRAFSIATVGCNIHCKFCQNWDISQAKPEDARVEFRAPEDIVRMALALKEKPRTIAYTYSEPTIFFEYMADCAKAARSAGLGNVVVSNGFIAEAPLKELCSLVTAIKIDFKAFNDRFYEEICEGRLGPVKETLKRLAGSGVWFEIVVLTIPTLNDNLDEIRRMAAWISKELGPNVPLHFTRFHPDYKLRNLPPTPVETLTEAREAAMAEGCNFVYTGNAPGEGGQNTFCPSCKAVVIDRYGFSSRAVGLRNGRCARCGAPIPGVWD